MDVVEELARATKPAKQRFKAALDWMEQNPGKTALIAGILMAAIGTTLIVAGSRPARKEWERLKEKIF